MHRLHLTCVAVLLMLAAGFSPAAAQRRMAREGAGDTQILLLGTAGGPPLQVDRSEPSALLIVDGHRYLIDCGIGTARRLVRAGIRPRTIGAIFITHHHPDHDLGLAAVMASDVWQAGRRGSHRFIGIYGPPQTTAFVKLAFKYLSIPYGVFAVERMGPRLADPFVSHDIHGAGVVYQDAEIRVTAAENSHYRLIPHRFHKEMKSFAYRFETPHGVVVFTGDTGPSVAVARLARGADVLVSEVMDSATVIRPFRTSPAAEHMRLEHLDEREVGQLASSAHVASVVLDHFVPDKGVAPATFVSDVREYYSGPVFAGADLQRYCLEGRSGARTTAPTLRVCR